MMLRMGEAAELANLDRVLHHYRVHRGSINGRGMSRLRFGIDYARELARRRRNGLPPLSVEEYQANLERRPWWRRLAERVDIYARSHYRLALAEIYGGRRARGAVRMAWAAACQPKLTAERIGRALGRRFRGRGTASTT
ncbi:MAG TPA: hypothetical protein PJ982_03355 [Lacipirellulaceae bacterium]|nr:hypothetical protein [Lacipirellulaceae bacterium]